MPQHLVSASNPRLVLDVTGQNTSPGTIVGVWLWNAPSTANQLWDLVPPGLLVSGLGANLVLEIANPYSPLGSPVQTGGPGSPPPLQQTWYTVPAATSPGYFWVFSNVRPGGLVLTVGAPNPAGGAQMEMAQQAGTSYNQLWTWA